MICLKCGADTKSEHIFCQRCLDGMAAYPVKPDAHVQLPDRSEPPAPKKTWRKRRILDTDEQLAHLRSNVRHLTVLVLLLTAILGVTVAMLVSSLQKEEPLNIGKNYTYQSNTD